MKLWKKEYAIDNLVEAFTIGRDPEFDLKLARYDVEGSLAHIEMLCAIGLLTPDEHIQLKSALQGIWVRIESGTFIIEPGVEDVHSQIELLLTRELGDTGKKVHSGRSRNDQVLVDLRLFFRAEIRELALVTRGLFDVLLGQADRYRDVRMPGYTHTQVAMISSFGLWFSAYAETLVDDLTLLGSVYRINNQNPLGSAAGYGSSFPIDREMTTRLLGFEDLNYNVIHAQMGRGKTEQFLSFALAGFGSTLGKLASDVILYSSQNFGFLSLPREFTTGSSIMPHKKNPDVFELIRGRCNLLQALPGQVTLLTTNLSSGYHRDFQLLKEVIFPSLEHLKDCFRLATYCLERIDVHRDIMADERYQYVYTVEAVNKLVTEGVPFRDAYQQVGQQIENGQFTFEDTVNHRHAGSIGNLCLDAIRGKMQKAEALFT